MPLPMIKDSKKSIKNIIAIAAGKGGVGKSTITVNLALALKKRGFSVGIIDTDVYGPSLKKMLPPEQPPLQKEQTLFPATCSGIKVISMAYFRKEEEASAVRAPIANGIVTQFIKNVDWGNLDFLLIDFPPGTGDIQITICQQAALTGALMITTPQEVAIMDVKKAMNLFDQLRVPIIGVIENMSYYLSNSQPIYLFGKGGGEKLAREAGVPLLGEVPVDPILSQSGDQGKSIFNETNFGETTLTETFFNIAERVMQSLDVIKESSEKTALSIKQKDNSTLLIHWNDGSIGEYRFSELQKNCPCANCVDETTGKRFPNSVREDVQVRNIQKVGRYALKFEFTSGCSSGIFSYEMLHLCSKN